MEFHFGNYLTTTGKKMQGGFMKMKKYFIDIIQTFYEYL